MKKGQNNAIKEAFNEAINFAKENGNPVFTGDEMTFLTKDGEEHKVAIWTSNVNESSKVVSTLKAESNYALLTNDEAINSSIKYPRENTADIKRTSAMPNVYQSVEQCGYVAILRTPDLTEDRDDNQSNVSFIFSTDPISVGLLANVIDTCACKEKLENGKKHHSVMVDYFHDGLPVIYNEEFSSTSASFHGRQNSLIAASVITEVGQKVGYENLGYENLAKETIATM